MSYWNQSSPYQVDKAIIAFVDNISTPYSLTVNATDVSVDSEGRKQLPAGLFVAQVGNKVRFLPRALTSTALVAGTSTTVTLAAPYSVFLPGDVLYASRPYVVITLAGTWLAPETVTLTIRGRAQTVVVGSTSIPTILTTLAAAFNTNAPFANEIDVVSDGVSKLYVYGARDGLSIAIATNSASGTVAIGGSATVLSANATPIGTVQSIDPVTGIVTLTSTSGIALPAGVSVGVNVGQIYGVYPHSIDFTNQPTKHIAPVFSCRGVYIGALPYYDESLATSLPGIPFQYKF